MILPSLKGLRIPCPFLSPEVTPEYQESEVGISDTMPYADIVYHRAWSFGEREKWIPLLKDQVIVDLAAGKNPYGYLLACEAEAAAYIAVEAHHARSLMINLSPESLAGYFERLREDEHDWRPPAMFIPNTVVALDMLTFLQKLNTPVSIFGIGLHHILPTRGTYVQDVSNQISRVLADRGCMVTYPEGSGLSAPDCYGSRLGCCYIYTREPRKSDLDLDWA
jgi:hypothetical protein